MKQFVDGNHLTCFFLGLRQCQNRLIKKPILLFSLSLAFISTVCLSGCAGTTFQPSTAEVPTFTQDQEVTLITPFKIKIDKAYWTDRFEKAGYSTIANLPTKYRSQQEAMFIAKPSAKFLVVDITVSNLGRESVSWVATKPPIFMLVNAEGSKYSPVGQEINMDDLSAQAMTSRININPGMSFKGKKVFDVPEGTYHMEVSLGRQVGAWSFAAGPTLFNWNLNPQEKK